MLITASLTTLTSCDDILEAILGGQEQHHDPVLDPVDDNYRTFYQIFVGSFADANEDGFGDLRGGQVAAPGEFAVVGKQFGEKLRVAAGGSLALHVGEHAGQCGACEHGVAFGAVERGVCAHVSGGKRGDCGNCADDD